MKLNGNLDVRQSVGIDISDKLINSAVNKRFSKVKFFCDIIAFRKKFISPTKFDFIIISDTIGYFRNIQKTLESIHDFCKPETRIVISYFSLFGNPFSL